MQHRLFLALGLLFIVVGTFACPPRETGAQSQFIRISPPLSAIAAPTLGSTQARSVAAAQTDSTPVQSIAAPAGRIPAQSVVAAPAAQALADYAFYPPTVTPPGQPVRLLVVLHGMGGNGPDMAAALLAPAQARGWAVLAPTMPYGDFLDPELVRQDGALLPRLKALIDSLPARTGLAFESKVMLFGFSRGSQEAIRFSLMFPDVTLGVAGLSAGSYTLPSTTYKSAATDPAQLLRYPFGTGDVASICGRSFNPDAVRQVSYWIGVGSTDNRVEDVPRQWDQYVGTNRVERAKRYVEVLQQFGAPATFTLFQNAGHEVTDPMRTAAVAFLASLPS